MTPRRHSITLLLALLVAGAVAQTPTFSDRFDRQGVSGRVFAVGEWRGDLVVGGYTFEVDGQTIHHVARFDGARWHRLGGGIAPDSDQIVRDVCEYNGDLIVAGTFDTAGGVRVNDIGRFDGTRWWPLGSGFAGFVNLTDGEIFALEVWRGDLYAAGNFTSAGGRPMQVIARWDGQMWQQVGSGVGGSFEPKGLSLCVHGDELWLGGEFDTAGGVPARNVAVWNGSSWRPAGAGLGTAVGSGVHALASFGGDVYGSGAFLYSGSILTRRIARWDGSAWRPLGHGIPDYSVTAKANALTVFHDRLWVGGDFAYVDSPSNGSGIRAYSLASWDGASWSGGSGVRGGYQTVIALGEWNGQLVVGGEFHEAGSPPLYPTAQAAADLAAFDGQRWVPVGEGLGFDGGPARLLRWRNRLVAAGQFNGAGADHGRGIAAFDGGRWQALADLQNGAVTDGIEFGGDLWVTGSFRYLNGLPTTGTIRNDGTGWQQMPPAGEIFGIHNNELYAAGLGYVRRWDGAAWQALPQLFGQVLALASFQGRLVAAGSGVGGNSANIVELVGSAWRPLGGGVDLPVTALHVANGQLHVGGEFTRAGTVATARFATWDGSSWLGYGSSLDGQNVRTIAFLNGVLHVGGSLGRLGTGSWRYLARWDGTRFVAYTDFDGYATDLLADDRAGDLWIAGAVEAGGHPSAGIALLSTRGAWLDLGQGLAGTLGTPQLDGFGQLTLGALASLQVRDVPAFAPGVHVIGAARVDVPFQGGTIVPSFDAMVPFLADPRGWHTLSMRVPATLGSGQSLYAQSWLVEPANGRFAASNALRKGN